MEDVWDLCREDLQRVEEQIHSDLKSNLSLISIMGSHLINSGGKRFRPLLMILTSRLAGYTGKSHTELASVIELIHAATLFHDDVIDEASTRRGNKTARMLWGNQASILVGDYLYAKAQCTIVSFHNHDLNETITEATRKMAKGELAQMAFNGDLSITEEDYLEIIGNKTASLMAATCRIGAILGECSSEQRTEFESFGWNIGMAFQLADDTLDYIANKAKFGKSVGKDLEEGKVTLPLLALLTRCSQADAEKMEHEHHPLVELAREAIKKYLEYREVLKTPDNLTAEMKERHGVFVSLKMHGMLRGCIGTFEPSTSCVAEEVIHNAISSAVRDPRFTPVTLSEITDIVISVDVLTSPEPVKSDSDLDIRRYGVIVQSGHKRGLLLPDLEGIDTVEEQIGIAKRKAGIGAGEPVDLLRFEVKRYK